MEAAGAGSVIVIGAFAPPPVFDVFIKSLCPATAVKVVALTAVAVPAPPVDVTIV